MIQVTIKNVKFTGHSCHKHGPRSIPTQSRRKSRHDCPKQFYDAARTEVEAMISESVHGWYNC